MATLKLHDILWEVKGAGPSPEDNRRTEIYFAGCQKALSGNPCKNCFNPQLWSNKNNIPINVKDIIYNLEAQKIPKYITIVGGEPTDQLEGLLELIFILKEKDYHIMLFTWRSFSWLYDAIGPEYMRKIDILVTEPYDENYRIYDSSKDDGIHNAIGSGNQEIYISQPNGKCEYYKAEYISSIQVDKDNNVIVRLIEKQRKSHNINKKILKAAKILAKNCEKNITCDKCLFLVRTGHCILQKSGPWNWASEIKDRGLRKSGD